MTTPTPTPSNPPNPPITLEPDLWYTVAAGCANSTCERYNVVYQLPNTWSNADGDPRITCGVCNSTDVMVSAVVMDPQPVES